MTRHLLPELCSRSTKFINLPSQVNKQIINDLIENIYCSSDTTSTELEVRTINHLKSFSPSHSQDFCEQFKASEMNVNVKDIISVEPSDNLIQSKSFNSDTDGNREDSGFSSQSARDDSTTEDEMPRSRGLVRSNTFDLICKQTDVDLADINNTGRGLNNADNPMVKSEILPSGKTYSSGTRSSSARAKSTSSRRNKSDLMRKSSFESSSCSNGHRPLRRPPFILDGDSASGDDSQSSAACESARSIFQFFVDMKKLPRTANAASHLSSNMRRGSPSVTLPMNCTGEHVTRGQSHDISSDNDTAASAGEITNRTQSNRQEKSPGLICFGEEEPVKREEIASHASSLPARDTGAVASSSLRASCRSSPHPQKLKSPVCKANNASSNHEHSNLGGQQKSSACSGTENQSHVSSDKNTSHVQCHSDMMIQENSSLPGQSNSSSSRVLVVMDDRLAKAKNFFMGKSLMQSQPDDCEPMVSCMSRSFISTTGATGTTVKTPSAPAAESSTVKSAERVKSASSKMPVSSSKVVHRSRMSTHERSATSSAMMSISWCQEARNISSASSACHPVTSVTNEERKKRTQSPGMSGASSTNELTSSIYLANNELSGFMIKSRSSHFSMDRSVERGSNCNSPSSMMSSMTRSVLRRSSSKVRNSKLDEERISRTFESVSKLGDDLLKMFINQVNPDLTIECIPEAVQVMDVSTNTTTIESSSGASIGRINAHKCILASRSPYFNAMFTGNWMEKSSSTVQMVGFSYDVVYYALCHLYSGTIMLPTNIEISEIALISDLLGLTTLRDTVIHELKMTFCHFFHKPCKECSIGVLDCLVLSHTCSLWDLKSQCLTWLGKHWTRIWPTKPFASLSQYPPLHDECYMATLETVTVETAIDAILSCERLLTTMPRVKWAEPVFNLVNLLMTQCTEYITDHFDCVLSSKSFISLSRGRDWNVQTIEEPFISAISAINCETACKSLVQLTTLVETSLADTGFGNGPYTESFSCLIRKLFRNVERFLIHNADHAITCSSWNLLSNEAKVRIRESAVMVYEFDKPHAPKPMLSSSVEKSSQAMSSRPNTSSPSHRRKNNSRKVNTDCCVDQTSSQVKNHEQDESKSSTCCNKNGTRIPITSPTAVRRKSSSKIHGNQRLRSTEAGSLSGHHTSVTCKVTGNYAASNDDSGSNSISSDQPVKSPSEMGTTASSTSSVSGRVSSRIPLTSLANAPASNVKRKSSQVAKVSPFNSRKISIPAGTSAACSTATDAPTCGGNSSSPCTSTETAGIDPEASLSCTGEQSTLSRHDLSAIEAEMDAESTLVQNCLAEAQHLERELSRKLKQYQTRVDTSRPNSRTVPTSSASSSSSSRVKSISSSNVTASPSRSIRPKSSNNSSCNNSSQNKKSTSTIDTLGSHAASTRLPSK